MRSVENWSFFDPGVVTCDATNEVTAARFVWSNDDITHLNLIGEGHEFVGQSLMIAFGGLVDFLEKFIRCVQRRVASERGADGDDAAGNASARYGATLTAADEPHIWSVHDSVAVDADIGVAIELTNVLFQAAVHAKAFLCRRQTLGGGRFGVPGF